MNGTIYCTYFNKGYLSRGIVLLRSFAKFASGCKIEVLCFDDETFDFLSRHDSGNVIPMSLTDFESRHPELTAIKPTRSRGEYFFTCTSSWTLDVLRRHPESSLIAYLDADMKFYASPDRFLEEMRDKDIIICDHNFERGGERQAEYGRYNVGFLAFRNNATGLECLRMGGMPFLQRTGTTPRSSNVSRQTLRYAVRLRTTPRKTYPYIHGRRSPGNLRNTSWS